MPAAAAAVRSCARTEGWSGRGNVPSPLGKKAAVHTAHEVHQTQRSRRPSASTAHCKWSGAWACGAPVPQWGGHW